MHSQHLVGARTCKAAISHIFLNICIVQRPGVIKIDQGPYVQSKLAKYPIYIGTRKYADVPSMTEYRYRDALPRSPKQLEYVLAYPYAEIVCSVLYLAVVARPDRYSLTDAFAVLVTTLGHWEVLYNRTNGLTLVHFYDRDDRVGQKCVLSNAHVRETKKPPMVRIPVYDDYNAQFVLAEISNKSLYHCTWPHKHDGRGLLGDLCHQHNFAISCVLQNMFNAYVHTNRLRSTSFSISEHCLLLAEEMYYYMTHLGA